MTVSVVVVNFNGRDVTPGCLESIPAGVETVVVDNASTDGSPDEIAARFPKAALIRNAANLGFARAVNQGVDATRGKYVCLLNPDARLSPDTLASLEAFMDAHPDVGMAAPQLVHEDGRRQHSFDNFPSLATVFFNKSLLRLLAPGKYPSKRKEYTEPLEVESVIGACMMVRRSLIDRIGPLDEAYFLFLEETDWCLRARRAGAKVVFIPSTKVVHLQGRSRDKVRIRARIEYTRSMFTFFRKNRPGSCRALGAFFWLRTLLALLAQTLGLFMAGTRRRWTETAAVLGWELCGRPRAWGLSAGSDPNVIRMQDGTRVFEDHAEAFNDYDGKRRQRKVIEELGGKRRIEYAVGGRTYLVKVYKDGGLGKRIATFLFGSRAWREWTVSSELLARGVPCAPVVAMREKEGENWVAVERLSDWRQLQEALLDPALDPRRLSFLYGRFARRLHDAGVVQYDFNATNVLVKDEEFRLIDFERVKNCPGRVPDRDRWWMLAKANRIPALSRANRWRFLRGYFDADADPAARAREAIPRILAVVDRQSARDEERNERRCLEDNRDFGLFDADGWRGHYLKKRPEREGGLTVEDLRAIAEGSAGPLRMEPADDAVAAWTAACRASAPGRPGPLAVIHRKGESRGRLVYPQPASSEKR